MSSMHVGVVLRRSIRMAVWSNRFFKWSDPTRPRPGNVSGAV